jgi:hypothetical protein
MTPNSWVIDISAEESWDGRSREELDLFATIVSASEAWLTFVADDIWLNGYSIADFEMLD